MMVVTLPKKEENKDDVTTSITQAETTRVLASTTPPNGYARSIYAKEYSEVKTNLRNVKFGR